MACSVKIFGRVGENGADNDQYVAVLEKKVPAIPEYS
jgi:hypothetical protein